MTIGLIALLILLAIGLTVYVVAAIPKHKTVRAQPPTNIRRFTQNGWR